MYSTEQGEEEPTTYICQDLPGSTMPWLIRVLRPEYRFTVRKR